MWKEWLTPYNTFNALKILAWKQEVAQAVSWLNGKKKELSPPSCVTIHPTNLCQVNCFWCKNRENRTKNGVSLPNDLLLSLPASLSEWGVKSAILSGGEPLLHPKIGEFLFALRENDIEIGLKSNGVALSDPKIRKAVLETVEWVGISLDAASEHVYLKIKKANIGQFQKTIEAISVFAKERGEKKKPHITLKFLIHHLNYSEVFIFVDMAKKLGADDVHLRPLYFPRYAYTRGVRKTAESYLRDARKSFEDEDFHVFAIITKYDRDWKKIIRFEKCLMPALTTVFSANKKAYLCPDRVGDEKAEMRSFTNFDKFREFWGSDAHRQLLRKVTPQLCLNCGYSLMNEAIEKCLVEDAMWLKFL